MDDSAPHRDFEAMLDLDRSTLTRNFVDRIEALLRAQEEARNDLKDVLDEALHAEFRKHDIAAMKKIAKLRLQDKVGDAREQLAALERISEIVGMPLFDWSAAPK